MGSKNFKKGGSSLPVDSFSHFDLLINPGDSIEEDADEKIISQAAIKCVQLYSWIMKIYSQGISKMAIGSLLMPNWPMCN